MWFANAVQEIIIMQITSSYSTTSNINYSARVTSTTARYEASVTPPASYNTSTTTGTGNTQSLPLNNASVSNLSAQATNIGAPETMMYEINILMQQFSEWVRVASESKRMEFLYNISLKENHEKSDMFGTIMDIARRIMKGENVEIEEMCLLSDQNPQLFFVAIMLKDEVVDTSGQERRSDRDRRKKDRRSTSRRREFNIHSHEQPNTKITERTHFNVPKDLAAHVHSLLVNKSIKNSYTYLKNSRNLPKSVNAVITSPHEIAG